MPALPYQKPYKSFDEQVSLLESRGIEIGDRQEAAYHLQRLGYYRLSAYWYPFRQRAESHVEGVDTPANSVVDGVVFMDIVAICDFDSRLRNVLLQAIEAVEVAIRVALAYELGKYGPLGYLDKDNLGPGCDNTSLIDPAHTDFAMFLHKQAEMVDKSKEDFARHFRDVYGGVVPVWVAIELWDFGTLSRFYQFLTASDRSDVAARFGLSSGKKLANWLECLNDLRNVCAHHSRLNRRHFPKNPSFPRSRTFPQFAHLRALSDRELHRLYPLICVLMYLLDQSTPSDACRARVTELIGTVNDVNGLKLADFAIPDFWQREPLWDSGMLNRDDLD